MIILTRVTPLLFLFILCISCATPIAPTGGVSDSEGPTIVRSYPENGSTNITTQFVEIEFSEYVNRSSLAANLQIEPDIGIDYSLRWKKRTLFIEFTRHLPDSTTLLITLGNKVSDTRNNTMGTSLTIAFSTGDQIDAGSLTGKILKLHDGRGIEEKEVFLFPYPYRVGDVALYRAESDTGGNFQFNYLRNSEYIIVQLDDRNRNKQWDSALERVRVFERDRIDLRTEAADTLGPLYISERDTLLPEVLGVGLLSDKRLRIRFSEPIFSESKGSLNITPKFESDRFTASTLYFSISDPSVAYAQSDKPFLEDSSYTVEVNDFADVAGNVMDRQYYTLVGSGATDTTQQRFIQVNPMNELSLQDSIVMYYAAPISQRAIVDSLRVIEGVVEIDSWPKLTIRNNRIILSADPEWKDGVDYQILAWNPKTQRRVLIPYVVSGPNTWGSLELVREGGSGISSALSGNSTASDSMSVELPEVRFQLYDTEQNMVREGIFSEMETIHELPAREYTLRLYIDTNDNGEWDAGEWDPYVAPEPIILRNSLKIQAGFTSTIQFSFD